MVKISDQATLRTELHNLNRKIKTLLSDTGYAKYGELELSFDHQDPDAQFFRYEYAKVLEKLDSLHSILNYLERPVVAEGTLYKNSRGRFEIDPDYEFTSGSPLEFFYYDDYDECSKWAVGRIEHSEDYYIYGYKTISLDGLRVRVRR